MLGDHHNPDMLDSEFGVMEEEAESLAADVFQELRSGQPFRGRSFSRPVVLLILY